MAQPLNLSIERKAENKVLFTGDKITITAGYFSYEHGKHRLAEPETAQAQIACCGKIFNIKNTACVPTIEEWYFDELLPKMHMLDLYLGDIPKTEDDLI